MGYLEVMSRAVTLVRRAAAFPSAAAIVLACTSEPVPPEPPPPNPSVGDVCPIVEGEFTPPDCALVRGTVRDTGGRPVGGLGIRVDSIRRGNAYHYGSNSTMTDASGRFTVVVFRVNRLDPVTSPDTASVEIKRYASQDPQPRDTPNGRALVHMYFAELGKSVKVTIIDSLVFANYATPP